MAPQFRQTWYEYPSIPIGQPILPCQHPLNAATATPAKPLATTPGHHQLNFFGLKDFCGNIGSVITSPETLKATFQP
jgi:hypothetical protein